MITACRAQIPELLQEEGIDGWWSKKEDASEVKSTELSWEEMRKLRQEEAQAAMARAKQRDQQQARCVRT